MIKSFLFVSLMIFSAIANANCWYNGYLYPTGTVVGGLTCQADGGWR